MIEKMHIYKESKNKQRKMYTVTLYLVCILIVFAVLSLMIGNTWYSLQEVFSTVFMQQGDHAFTILNLRLPRMINGILCGIAFGLAGSTFQKLLRNPLASPDIIGVSAGASIGALFSILVLQLSGSSVSIAAIISGLVCTSLLFLLARKDHFSNGKLILIGIGAQAFLNAIISYLLLRAAQYDVASALRWLSGSLNHVTMENAISLVGPVVIIAIILCLKNHHLSILELGDGFATTLGINVTFTKVVLFICALLLIAFASSVSGPIASVAFLSGPIASRINKGNTPSIMQAGLVGAILVLVANLIAQNAFDARYPVGVITGILGAPYLLYLLLQWNKKGGY